MLRAYDIIHKKRIGDALSEEEIKFMVNGYLEGSIPDYQMSAFLMAIVLNGMTDEEISSLVRTMAFSGDVLDLSDIPGVKVDKHSTGGVGDSVTLVVVPLLASLGVKVPKLSGRALGHTGGTIDKLESIPGFQVKLPVDRFKEQVKRIGCAIAEASLNLAPADKKIYALRDVTATVDSLPLIASSIMSKKIAAGADAIVLDVKVGSGAFLRTYEEARKLASIMVNVGKAFGKRTVAILTDMDQPLSPYVGNALEVKGVIEYLHDPEAPKFYRFHRVVTEIASYMLLLGRAEELSDDKVASARIDVLRALKSGKGLEWFAKLIEAQGGDPSLVDNPDLLPTAEFVGELKADEEGVVRIDAYKVGIAAGMLGLAREVKGQPVDHTAGVCMCTCNGQHVRKGDILAIAYSNSEDKLRHGMEILRDAISISEHIESKVIYDVVT